LLTCAHYLPVGRARDLLETLTAIDVSTGFLAAIRGRASLSRFPCKPRVTNTVNLSQGESSWEEDDQRVQRRFPAVGSRS
jgi:hypothetical protein